MKISDMNSAASAAVAPGRNDSSKLVSLLALAAGAATVPQSANADIIFTDLSSSPALVGVSSGYGASFTFDKLPGDAGQLHEMGIARHTRTSLTHSTGTAKRVYKTVTIGRQGGSLLIKAQHTAAGLAAPQAKGDPWNSSLDLSYKVAVGTATTYGAFPAAGYNHQYLGFEFQDTTQPGSPVRYGWVEVDLNIGKQATSPYYSYGPDVTIYGYAYDDTGAVIQMGAVPEPAPMAILALGALTFGAKGVRGWRRNRSTTGQS